MLGTLAGIWITVIIFVIGALIVAGVLISSLMSSKPAVRDGSILYIELSGTVTERYPPLDVKRSLAGYQESTIALNEIVNAIDAAAEDERIAGIYLDCDGALTGTAACQEILQALCRFKESGKWVYAYADAYTQGNYYIASAADQIVLNPKGVVDIHGLSARTLFYKGLMDKAGIEAQVVKVGSYKSAVEPWTRTEMSEESRLQQQFYLDNIWKSISREIAANRGVSAQEVDCWADSLLLTRDPQKYLDLKIVDKLSYRHQLEEELRSLTGKSEDEKLALVSPEEYCQAVNPLKGNSKECIALLYAVGDIVDEGEGGISGKEYSSLILELAKKKEIKGLVLRVNSGGGSAYASEQIWEALEQFKETGKPLYVSMSDVAASGGYYISCGGDRIYAQKQTLTGSIGIFGIIPCVKSLMNDKLGITSDKVSTNPQGGLPSILEPMTPSQQRALQEYVERGYELFVSRCAQGRGIPEDSVKMVAQGRVWDGGTALELGLVDTIADLSTAIADMADLLDMEDCSVKEYPVINESFLQQFLSSEEISAGLPRGMEELGKCLEAVELLKGISPAQCRMEKIEIR